MASHEIIREPRIVLTLELSEAQLLLDIMHQFVPDDGYQSVRWTDLLNDLHDAINEANTGARD